MLGRCLSNCKNLRFFAANACNLAQDSNLKKLLDGLIMNVDNSALTIKPVQQKKASR